MVRKDIKKDSGITTLEVLFAMVIIIAAIVIYYNNSNSANIQTQLAFAKNNALKQAQITGGLTPAIEQNVINTLSRSNVDPSKIIVTSPQTAPVPYGGEIQIDIYITSNPQPGVDINGKQIQSTKTLHAQGTIVSQYSP